MCRDTAKECEFKKGEREGGEGGEGGREEVRNVGRGISYRCGRG